MSGSLIRESHVFASQAGGGQFNGLYKIEGKNRKSEQAKTAEEEEKRRKAEEEEIGPRRKTRVHLNPLVRARDLYL
jgi:hypothetical protein